MRASRVAGLWRISERLEEEEFWENLEPPSEEVLTEFREVLWRKYQRRRVPWEHVREIDKLLGKDEP